MVLSIEALVQVIAVATALFISLLPVTYMNWRERFLTIASRESKMVQGLGPWMQMHGVKEVHFHWGAGHSHICQDIDITTMPISLREHLETLPDGLIFEQFTPFNPDRIIFDGLNIMANKVLIRAYRNFIALMAIQSSILVGSTVALSSIGNTPFTIPISTSDLLIVVLIISVVSYLLYAASMFKDSKIRWYTEITLDANRHAIIMTSELWNSG